MIWWDVVGWENTGVRYDTDNTPPQQLVYMSVPTKPLEIENPPAVESRGLR